MAFSEGNSVQFNGANGGTSGAIDTTNAVALIATISCDSSVTPTISDSKSNTWIAITAVTNNSIRQKMFYVLAPVTDAAHTFTCGPSSSFDGMAVMAVNGPTASFVSSSSGGSAAGNLASVQPGSVTPGGTNGIAITGLAYSGATTLFDEAAIDSGTIVQKKLLIAATSYGFGLAYLVTSSAYNPTWSWTTSGHATSTVIALNDGGSGPTFPSGILNTPVAVL